MPSRRVRALVADVLRAIVAMLVLLAAGVVQAQRPLVLDDAVAEAWPAMRVLADPTHELTLDQVRGRLEAFAVPEVPAGNFGARRETLWLHLPVEHRSGPARRVLEVDYPPLNRVEVFVVVPGRAPQLAVMGNALAAEQRPLRTRAHAAFVELPALGRADIFLRVQTTSAMVVPVRLFTEEAFVAHDSARQLLQGLLFGIGLALLFYAVANGVGLRDPLFAQYAVLVIGISVFLVAYTGIGHQHLWDRQTGLLAKVAPLGVLLAVVGGSLFAANALQMQLIAPRSRRGLQALAVVSAVAMAASVAGLLDYRQTQAAATVLGPLPLLLALRVAWLQARTRDPVAVMMLVGWGAYTAGAIAMVLLLRGFVAADFWAQHAFQFSALVEMLAWVRVLGMRIEGIRREAERAALEKGALQAMANTDPLTGLPNRRGLAAALQTALPAARPDSALAVFVIDLDGFKPVNDRLGHDAGDELLVQVGARLRGVLRQADVVTRLGGDEFVVMSAGLHDEADATRIGRKMLAAFDAPFEVQGQHCRVGATVGYALAPHDGREAGDLLKRADAAMYAGKQAGRDCLRRGGASPGLAGS